MPVLSEQMTDVQPRVSTDGKLRTMAFFLAMRRVPKARQVVMTAGRPERSSNRTTEKERINTNMSGDKLLEKDILYHEVLNISISKVGFLNKMFLKSE